MNALFRRLAGHAIGTAASYGLNKLFPAHEVAPMPWGFDELEDDVEYPDEYTHPATVGLRSPRVIKDRGLEATEQDAEWVDAGRFRWRYTYSQWHCGWR